MEAVCTLLNEPTDWENAKRVIGGPNFVNSLVKFDKDNIPQRTLQKLARCADNVESLWFFVAHRTFLTWKQVHYGPNHAGGSGSEGVCCFNVIVYVGTRH
jgi:hypothetical protein